MAETRKIEVFSAGCAVCEDTIALINRLACPSCEIEVHDMRQADIATKARSYGIRSIPAVVVNGELLDCCAGRAVDEAGLKAAGVGTPL